MLVCRVAVIDPVSSNAVAEEQAFKRRITGYPEYCAKQLALGNLPLHDLGREDQYCYGVSRWDPAGTLQGEPHQYIVDIEPEFGLDHTILLDE